jgi:hypothetical protein
MSDFAYISNEELEKWRKLPVTPHTGDNEFSEALSAIPRMANRILELEARIVTPMCLYQDGKMEVIYESVWVITSTETGGYNLDCEFEEVHGYFRSFEAGIVGLEKIKAEKEIGLEIEQDKPNAWIGRMYRLNRIKFQDVEA